MCHVCHIPHDGSRCPRFVVLAILRSYTGSRLEQMFNHLSDVYNRQNHISIVENP
ncbi:hypothetical protein CORMATOL_01700 [Corynebacterium matruchotii ATCC 33806]|uniref:Uncharacterized protein n=1 Tax=Corynebacterium matruchotii ATCC 33806 TaxID=566549 RepID=C0E3X9_9CORY|nr:hypothetical protein CORMATOL_01700 [Corynebacterium matruchotii ATCC 33806]